MQSLHMRFCRSAYAGASRRQFGHTSVAILSQRTPSDSCNLCVKAFDKAPDQDSTRFDAHVRSNGRGA
eukprot:4340579-Alexandrium_andersonii.AAC.2